MILALKTSTDPTEVYILDDNSEVITQQVWDARRELAHDLLGEIEKLVGDFTNLTGIIVFRGPGSFTGLRIGITIANAISYAQKVPIIGTNGDGWLTDGLQKLAAGENDKIIIPEYGTPPHITKPKK